MTVVYLELLTGEQFLYETKSFDADVFMSGVRSFNKKSLYRVVGRTNPDGTASFGFVRMDNDFFPPQDQALIASDKIVVAYAIEPNSDVYRGFEAAMVKEAAKATGLVLVK